MKYTTHVTSSTPIINAFDTPYLLPTHPYTKKNIFLFFISTSPQTLPNNNYSYFDMTDDIGDDNINNNNNHNNSNNQQDMFQKQTTPFHFIDCPIHPTLGACHWLLHSTFFTPQQVPTTWPTSNPPCLPRWWRRKWGAMKKKRAVCNSPTQQQTAKMKIMRVQTPSVIKWGCILTPVKRHYPHIVPFDNFYHPQSIAYL